MQEFHQSLKVRQAIIRFTQAEIREVLAEKCMTSTLAKIDEIKRRRNEKGGDQHQPTAAQAA